MQQVQGLDGRFVLGGNLRWCLGRSQQLVGTRLQQRRLALQALCQTRELLRRGGTKLLGQQAHPLGEVAHVVLPIQLHLRALRQRHGHRLGALAHAREPGLRKHVQHGQRQHPRFVGAGHIGPAQFDLAIRPGAERLARPVVSQGLPPLAAHRIAKPHPFPGNARNARTLQNGPGALGPAQRVHVGGQGQQLGQAAAHALPAVPHRPGRQQQHQPQGHQHPRQRVHAPVPGSVSGDACRWMPNFFMW